MKIKKLVKKGATLLIESNGSLTAVIIRASKKQLLAALDVVLPDDEPEKT